MVRMTFGTPLEQPPVGSFSGPSKARQDPSINPCRGLAARHHTTLLPSNTYVDLPGPQPDRNDTRRTIFGQV